jgi:hypothetical protein
MHLKRKNWMGNKYLKGLLVGISIALFSFPASAQTLEVGLFGGGTYYHGEMNPVLPFRNVNLAYGAIVRYNPNLRWAFRASYQRGDITGVDDMPGRVEPRDFSFNTTINDISLIAEFNFLEYFTGSNKNYFSPYLFIGISGFIANYKPVDSQLEQYNSDPLIGFAIPFGFGIKYSVSKRIAIGFEWGMRKSFSDYLDGVNALEYQTGNLPDLESGETRQSDDNLTGDWYNFTGITVAYKIDLRSKTKCNLEGW